MSKNIRDIIKGLCAELHYAESRASTAEMAAEYVQELKQQVRASDVLLEAQDHALKKSRLESSQLMAKTKDLERQVQELTETVAKKSAEITEVGGDYWEAEDLREKLEARCKQLGEHLDTALAQVGKLEAGMSHAGVALAQSRSLQDQLSTLKKDKESLAGELRLANKNILDLEAQLRAKDVPSHA